MASNRKPSRRPYASRYRLSNTAKPRPIGNVGGGQGGVLGGPSSGGLR